MSDWQISTACTGFVPATIVVYAIEPGDGGRPTNSFSQRSMRQIASHPLWIGHALDGRDVRASLDAGIEALVDLAVNEPPVAITRELIYCRFPLSDGSGNPPWLLRSAAETVARLLQAQIPTLVFCSAGLSRSPCIAAAGLALALNLPPDECIRIVTAGAPSDVSPALWHAVVTSLAK